MSLGRLSVATLLLAASVASVALARQASQAPAEPRVLRVTSSADDASVGTLRWAIDSSNATPAPELIAIDVSGGAAAITLKSALPPVKGPVQIVGTAWKRNGEYAVIDGSGYVPAGGPESCPGATAGQAVYELMTTDLREDVAKITSDVLLVAAVKAVASTPSRLEAVLKSYEAQIASVPRRRVIAATNALHFVMLDDPQFLLTAMNELLGEGKAGQR